MSWNSCVRCIREFKPGKGTTLNKTYKIQDGRMTYDNGQQSMNEFANIEELNKSNSAKFEELKKRGRPKKMKEDLNEK